MAEVHDAGWDYKAILNVGLIEFKATKISE
jgi:hypothetical protein